MGGRGNIAAAGVRGNQLRDTDGRMGRSAVGSEPRRQREKEAAQDPGRLLDSALSRWGMKGRDGRHK